jgi:hypothetical protein
VSTDLRIEIRDLVQKAVNLLGSPEVAIDDQHGPKVYSQYLKSLLAAPSAQVVPPAPVNRRSLQHKSKSAPASPNREHVEYENTRASTQQPQPTPKPTVLMSPPPEPVNSFDVFQTGVAGMDMYNAFSVGAGPSEYNSMSVSDWRSSQLAIDEDLREMLSWGQSDVNINDLRGQ